MPGMDGNMTRTLLLGASGLVGSEALRIALDRSDISRVVAPTRHALPQHPKLINPVSSSLESLLPELPSWDVGSVMCALGTTRKQAGSDQGLRHVDYELPLAFAQTAHHAGVTTFAVVTSIGATPASPLFYARTKGELERDLAKLGFRSLTFLRPMFLDGDRAEARRGEAAVVTLAKTFAPLLPGFFRVSPVSVVARQLVAAAVEPRDGVHVISSRDLTAQDSRPRPQPQRA